MTRRPMRIDVSAGLAAVGAVALLASLFLTWYDPGLTAWTTFEVLDLVLAGLALASLVAAAGELGFGRAIPASWLPMFGGVAFVIVVAALINHPPLALGHPPRVGIWLALGSSLLILGGGLLRVARISLAVTFDAIDADSGGAVPTEAHTEPLPPHPGQSGETRSTRST